MGPLFWVSAAMLGYIFAGYPALVALRARFRPRRLWRTRGRLPRFSVVMIAYNEERNIRRKLENIARVGGMELAERIFVALDGSSDRTVEEVYGWIREARTSEEEPRRAVADRIQVVQFPRRRGKPAVINDIVRQCEGEVVVFMDVRQELDTWALRELLSDFADREVNVVSGELVFRRCRSPSAARGVTAYWRYEKAIRRWESASGSVPGATGALYAVRREMVPHVPGDILPDDVYIPMKATENGGRCVLEPRARIYDDAAEHFAEEEVRKRRTLAGNLQLALRQPTWMLPGGHAWWWRFLSHKILRLTCPLWLLMALFVSAVEADRPAYALALAAQAAFYTAAGMGLFLSSRGGRCPAILALPAVTLSFNFVIVRAFSDYWRGRIRVTWERANTGA
ncbi:MAG TPA: glycosyltransferase [Kiritimatiellae bacterium]|nr:glycosyltransferase [Kiritimatiellia bacterium]